MESIDYELDPNKIVGLRLQAQFWRYGMSEAKYIEDIFSTRAIKSNLFESYLPGFHFDIIAEDDDFECCKIGYIKGKLCDEKTAQEDGLESLFDLCEQIDDRSANMYEFIYENDNTRNTNYFSIDYIYIKEKYRHHKLAAAGIILLPEAISTQLNREVSVFVVTPDVSLATNEEFYDYNEFELGQDTMAQDTAKGLAFWHRLGFKQDADFMYFDTFSGLSMQSAFMQETSQCHCGHTHADSCECEIPDNVFDFNDHKRRR
ncbi:MAG: hypothetical protein LLG02_16495 [Pelosinus sp.]|nr:hypothetical protein [Pelosinus sp.]